MFFKPYTNFVNFPTSKSEESQGHDLYNVSLILFSSKGSEYCYLILLTIEMEIWFWVLIVDKDGYAVSKKRDKEAEEIPYFCKLFYLNFSSTNTYLNNC